MTVKKIDQLVPLQLYACVFRGERENILLKKTRELTDSVKVREFFKNNKYKISNYLQKEYGLSHEDYSKWAREAINQAKSFFKRINQLICNAQNGEKVDFSREFEVYKQFSEYPGVKVYGPKMKYDYMMNHSRRSLLRLWALEIGSAYLVVYAGIKLDYDIANCPGICTELEPRFKAAVSYLQNNGVLDENDLDELVKMLE